jgi:SPX domain protein involved in polyphosphate accumulation
MNANAGENFSRFEFKYILDPLTYMEVRDFISALGISHDAHSNGRPYQVTSLYYDSIGLDDYYDKAGGFLVRKKVRIRAYSHELDGTCDLHLEIKNKHDMYISKERALVSKEHWSDIESGDFTQLSRAFKYHLLTEGRIPVVIVRYEREAFDQWFHDRVRITLDRNIEAIRPVSLIAGKKISWYDAVSVSGPRTILEVKFEKRLPWWFAFMMKKFSLRRTAYSKYASAIDALYRYDPLPR